MTQPLFNVKPTPYGGRGAYASQPISAKTLVHVCSTPFASVIYREFRREVCAYCFAYAFDHNRNTWNTRLEARSGVWFCGEVCKIKWLEEENLEGLQVKINVGFDKMIERMKRVNMSSNPKMEQAALKPEEITQEFLDQAWLDAEKTSKQSSVPLDLEEIELDTARFVANGIISRYISDKVSTAISDTDTPELESESTRSACLTAAGTGVGRPTWSSFLCLQSSELNLLRSQPRLLTSHIKIYTLVRHCLPEPLKLYVDDSSTVRAVLARDHGNSFGLYEMNEKGDSEMLGFAMFVSGSYFNHDCEPNIRKERVGRSMHFYTTRDVLMGEELCTSYVDLDEPVQKRREQLSKYWYFDCVCRRCQREMV